jgi:tetratricopeptide (TPR) repeat protein
VQFRDGSIQPATLLSIGKEVDLSLLKIPSREIGSLPFSSARNEKIGETVVAVGCPFGLNHSVARGIISAPERVLDDRPLLQTDVPINPGNSGGPLLNRKGEVVGVVIGLLPEARGIAFAVPGREARRFLGESFFQMGTLFAEKKRYPEAGEALRKSVGFWPRSARAYSNLGEVYRRMKEINKAETAFTKAVEIDPQYADAHYNLGVLYDGELRDPGKAAIHYRKFLELEPNSPEAVRIGRWLAALEGKEK